MPIAWVMGDSICALCSRGSICEEVHIQMAAIILSEASRI